MIISIFYQKVHVYTNSNKQKIPSPYILSRDPFSSKKNNFIYLKIGLGQGPRGYEWINSFKYYHQNNFSAACILYLFLPFQKVIIKVWYLHIKGICSLNNESWNNYTFPNAIEKYIGVISWLLHHPFGKIEILTRKVKWCGFYYSFH